MVRLLLLFIIFLLLYLGFSILSQFDSHLTIKLYDYSIESSFFVFLVIYILITIIGFILLKLILLIIKLPNNLKELFLAKRSSNSNGLVMKSMAEIIMDEKAKFPIMIKKIDNVKNCSDVPQKLRLNTIFILAKIENDEDKKVKYLHELEEHKDFAAFATKELAQISYQNQHYEKSEAYAIKSFNLNEYDSDNLCILLKCYAKTW